MKQRKWLFVIGFLLLVLSSSLFFNIIENSANLGPLSVHSSANDQRKERKQQAETDQINTRAESLRENRNKEIRFKVTAMPEPPANADALMYPKYRSGGSGTRGAIRDQAGNLIWRATKDNPVYSISTSPDDSKIVVGAGDGNAYVITNKGERITDLPNFPHGKDMLGLGNWVWLDNNRLLGESGVQKFDENGNPAGCCQDHNMSESRLYVYDLGTEQMKEVLLPEDLRGKVVSIGKVLKTGELQIGHEGDRFGWYQVTDLQEKR